ncbi:hypothetical protein SynBMKMC1_02462 [Synechococcus sp. BMK-MC-1]|nr:hypothetical protein SynBMKMC1_02462 [Synechococcus sp. BMK-MC-1]
MNHNRNSRSNRSIRKGIEAVRALPAGAQACSGGLHIHCGH